MLGSLCATPTVYLLKKKEVSHQPGVGFVVGSFLGEKIYETSALTRLKPLGHHRRRRLRTQDYALHFGNEIIPVSPELPPEEFPHAACSPAPIGRLPL